MKRNLALVLYLLLILPTAAPAGVWDWEVFISAQSVRSLIRVGDELYGAANGGLVCFNLSSETFQTFTTAQGLSYNDIRAMTLDARGNLILGMGNASLDVFNLATHQVATISDFTLNSKIFQIYALYNDAGAIYAATDIGVSRLVYFDDWGRYLVEGNYTKLGTFAQEIPVKCIQVFNGGLWVGTSSGLARGDLSLPYLESPESWTNYTTVEGLYHNNVVALAVYRDTLYTASAAGSNPTSNRGLSRLMDSTFEALQISSTSNISFLKAVQDTLYYGRAGGIYRVQDGTGVLYGTYDAKGLAVEFSDDGMMWAGLERDGNRLGGLHQLIGNDWVLHSPPGPLMDVITDIAVDENGVVWLTGGQSGFTNGALAHYDGNQWANLTRQMDTPFEGGPVSPDSFFWNGFGCLAIDSYGGLWVGSNGKGAAWFHFEADTILANAFYPASSGRLFGIVNGPNFCVVRDLMTDGAGNVWICNSEASPIYGPAIAVVPEDFIQDTTQTPNWSYLSVPGAKAEYQVDRLVLDSFGRKWFGANNQDGAGIRILDDHGTLSAADDEWYTLLETPSDSITALACDYDGVVWVGTPAGVQYFYPTEDPGLLQGQGISLVLPMVQSVRAIGVDPQNNKWFGTSAGVSVLAADNYTWLDNYTSFEGAFPSPLPGDNVQAIAFDVGRGYAYLGTDKGLARLQTPYKAMGATVTSVLVWPNPFVLSLSGDARLYFDPSGLNENTEVKIYTAAGLLVKRLNLSQINSGWNGRNSNNELVGTGVYLLLAYSTDGSASVSKVAVIHP
jgi:ligand-binding sensor domain-containing protein